MGDALLETLEAFCSTARIERYRTAAVDDLDAATLYLWNIQLTEAMFPTVAVLEIALRNAVHTALTRREGTAYWFPSVIHPQALAKFRQVEADIHRRSGRGISPEKLVSELSFGFWT